MFTPRFLKTLSTVALGLGLVGGSLSLGVAPVIADTTQASAPQADAAMTKRLGLARQLLELDGSSESVKQAMTKIGPLLEKALMSEPSIASLPTDEKTKLVSLMGSALNDAIPELLDKYAVHYANNLSEGELTELVAEFKKPTVKKFSSVKLSAVSTLDSQFSAIGQQAAMKAMQQFAEWKKTKK